MKRSTFEELSLRHSAIEPVFFNQTRFRRSHRIDFPGLCAALVRSWWEESRRGRDALALLTKATPSFVEELIERQTRSLYLSALPLDRSVLGETAIQLLHLKYGTSDLSEIQRLMSAHGAGTTLELDLMLDHDGRIAEQHGFGNCSPDMMEALTGSSCEGLRLILLRAGHSGHRLGVFIDANRTIRFFDPNCGEVRFAAAAAFRSWFSDYWEASGCARRAAKAPVGTTPIRIYRFETSPHAVQK